MKPADVLAAAVHVPHGAGQAAQFHQREVQRLRGFIQRNFGRPTVLLAGRAFGRGQQVAFRQAERQAVLAGEDQAGFKLPGRVRVQCGHGAAAQVGQGEGQRVGRINSRVKGVIQVIVIKGVARDGEGLHGGQQALFNLCAHADDQLRGGLPGDVRGHQAGLVRVQGKADGQQHAGLIAARADAGKQVTALRVRRGFIHLAGALVGERQLYARKRRVPIVMQAVVVQVMEGQAGHLAGFHRVHGRGFDDIAGKHLKPAAGDDGFIGQRLAEFRAFRQRVGEAVAARQRAL